MKFDFSEDFLRDVKKLRKKIPSLEEDLKNFMKFIPVVDFSKNKRFILIKEDCFKNIQIIKTRLMVRSLKGASKTRLIFSFSKRGEEIYFIEIYLKNHKSREDFLRIDDYLNGCE